MKKVGFFIGIGAVLLLTIFLPVVAAAEAPLSVLQCETDPVSGKQINCICVIDETRNTLVVVVKKEGIYDTASVRRAIRQYTKAAAVDTGVVNGGIVKFEGSTIDELDALMDSLYADRNVAYVVLVGDDLPVAQDGRVHSITQKLELVKGEYRDGERECRELSISYVVPPWSDPDKVKSATLAAPKINKKAFVIQMFKTYTKYHRKTDIYFAKYKGFLRIDYDSTLPESFGTPLSPSLLGYSISPTDEVLNSNHQKIQSQLRRKHLLLYYFVHGAENSISMGINFSGSPERSYQAIYTTLEEYDNFVKLHGLPSLFVDAGACQATTISSPGATSCCWPQMFLKSGVWAYYSFGGGGTEVFDIQRALEDGDTFGHLLRKMPHSQSFIFGDIVAHFPAPAQNSSL